MNDTTLSAKPPSRWWFLPWMSQAMHPPTVTNLVPGVTGTNQPNGSTARIRSCRLSPASTVIRPDVTAKSRTPRWAVMSSTRPPALSEASP
jgi:hypothetical protein